GPRKGGHQLSHAGGPIPVQPQGRRRSGHRHGWREKALPHRRHHRLQDRVTARGRRKISACLSGGDGTTSRYMKRNFLIALALAAASVLSVSAAEHAKINTLTK